ncbi:MAG: PepSY domain-containing protein [Anaeromyxobacter sp.]|nr:PepSY domain-containing protein [Anaeromyxobacter sp.]MBL0274877.1 PepSY domain-containing protein [Anaeromyxobacter sp.]
MLVVVGLSGSLLALYPQVDRALNPDWAASPPRGRAPRPLQQVLDAAAGALPGHFLHSVFPPTDEQDVHHVWFTPSARDQSAMLEVLVDPWDGRVVGRREAVPTSRFDRRNFPNAVYTLHFQLLLGEAGGTVVGLAGLLLLCSGVSGVVLWWPRQRSLRRNLTVRVNGGALRFHDDLHRVTGFGAVAGLLAVAFTGAAVTFGSVTRPVVETLSTGRPPPAFEPLPAGAGPAIDADAALARALALAPGARLRCLWLPGASGPAWRVTLREPTGVAWAGGTTDLWLHPEGGEVLGHRPWSEATAGEVFLAWLLPLHGGSAFGRPGRYLAFALGLAPLLLSFTGGWLWWKKRAARRKVAGGTDRP